MSEIFSISVSVSSPARLVGSTWAILRVKAAKRLPIPLMIRRAKAALCLPLTLVFYIRRMCWKSPAFWTTRVDCSVSGAAYHFP